MVFLPHLRKAEEGIAAHWKYKDGPVSAQDEQRLAWLRQVVEWQRDVSDHLAPRQRSPFGLSNAHTSRNNIGLGKAWSVSGLVQ